MIDMEKLKHVPALYKRREGIADSVELCRTDEATIVSARLWQPHGFCRIYLEIDFANPSVGKLIDNVWIDIFREPNHASDCRFETPYGLVCYRLADNVTKRGREVSRKLLTELFLSRLDEEEIEYFHEAIGEREVER